MLTPEQIVAIFQTYLTHIDYDQTAPVGDYNYSLKQLHLSNLAQAVEAAAQFPSKNSYERVRAILFEYETACSDELLTNEAAIVLTSKARDFLMTGMGNLSKLEVLKLYEIKEEKTPSSQRPGNISQAISSQATSSIPPETKLAEGETPEGVIQPLIPKQSSNEGSPNMTVAPELKRLNKLLNDHSAKNDSLTWALFDIHASAQAEADENELDLLNLITAICDAVENPSQVKLDKLDKVYHQYCSVQFKISQESGEQKQQETGHPFAIIIERTDWLKTKLSERAQAKKQQPASTGEKKQDLQPSTAPTAAANADRVLKLKALELAKSKLANLETRARETAIAAEAAMREVQNARYSAGHAREERDSLQRRVENPSNYGAIIPMTSTPFFGAPSTQFVPVFDHQKLNSDKSRLSEWNDRLSRAQSDISKAEQFATDKQNLAVEATRQAEKVQDEVNSLVQQINAIPEDPQTAAERIKRETAEREKREAEERKTVERILREAEERKKRETEEREKRVAQDREIAERNKRELAEREKRETAERQKREALERQKRETEERERREAQEREKREAPERKRREEEARIKRQTAENAIVRQYEKQNKLSSFGKLLRGLKHIGRVIYSLVTTCSLKPYRQWLLAQEPIVKKPAKRFDVSVEHEIVPLVRNFTRKGKRYVLLDRPQAERIKFYNTLCLWQGKTQDEKLRHSRDESAAIKQKLGLN